MSPASSTMPASSSPDTVMIRTSSERVRFDELRAAKPVSFPELVRRAQVNRKPIDAVLLVSLREGRSKVALDSQRSYSCRVVLATRPPPGGTRAGSRGMKQWTYDRRHERRRALSPEKSPAERGRHVPRADHVRRGGGHRDRGRAPDRLAGRGDRRRHPGRHRLVADLAADPGL